MFVQCAGQGEIFVADDSNQRPHRRQEVGNSIRMRHTKGRPSIQERRPQAGSNNQLLRRLVGSNQAGNSSRSIRTKARSRSSSSTRAAVA